MQFTVSYYLLYPYSEDHMMLKSDGNTTATAHYCWKLPIKLSYFALIKVIGKHLWVKEVRKKGDLNKICAISH